MKNAIILHGRPPKAEYFEEEVPSPSNAHWLPWLQRELLRKDILAQTPEVAKPYEPRYENWAAQIERFNPNKETLLVGHSCGAGMIVQWLSKNPETRVGKVVLVAPWIDVEKDNWPAFDFVLEPNLAARTAGVTIFHSLDDAPEVKSSVEVLRNKLINCSYTEFENYSHFTFGSMKTTEFPELLEECLNR